MARKRKLKAIVSDGFKFGAFEGKITRALYKNGLFLDRRSQMKRDMDDMPHFKLEGEDMSRQRQRIFIKHGGQCQIKLPGCTGAATELDHIQGGTYHRCSCEHNLRPACANCHREKHGRTIRNPKITFTLVEQAVKDFDQIYPALEELEHGKKSDR